MSLPAQSSAAVLPASSAPQAEPVSLPVPIAPRRRAPPDSPFLGSSPTAASSNYASPSVGDKIYGSSPPPRGSSYDKSRDAPHAAAKRLWKRIQFDPSLERTAFTVGFVRTLTQPERKSGAEAWSLRSHDVVEDLPYAEFVDLFREEDIPFHRIAYFKQGGVTVWESEQQRSRRFDSGGGGSGPQGASWEQPSILASFAAAGGGGSPAAFAAASPAAAFLSPVVTRPPTGRTAAASGRRGSAGGSSSVETPGLVVRTPLHRRGSGSQLSGGSDSDEAQPASPGTAVTSRRRHGSTADDDDAQDVLLEGDSDWGGEEDEEDEEEEEEEEDCDDDDDDEGSAPGVRGGGADAVGCCDGSDSGATPELPEECWMAVLRDLSTRDLCMVSPVSSWLRGLAGARPLWQGCYSRLFGAEPQAEWLSPFLKRMCRRSELKAARWLEARVAHAPVGFANTCCLRMDSAGQVVSGDANAVRLWSHATNRRIATLQGHTARVLSVAFDDAFIVSGCAQSTLRVWSVDELRCVRTLRGHDGPVTACALLNGLPVSASEDGSVRVWDVNTSTVIMSMANEGAAAVRAIQVHNNYVVSAGDGGVDVWDVESGLKLYKLCATALVAPHGDPDFRSGGEAASDGGSSGDGEAAAAVIAGGGFGCVAYSGSLLAAGRSGQVVLWDPRSQEVVGTMDHGGRSGGHCRGVRGGGGGAPACVGVQLDEWKLVTAFRDGSNALTVHDVRAVVGSRGSSGGWVRPVQTLAAPSRVTCFQFDGQSLLAGQEGAECALMTFQSPYLSAPAPVATASSAATATASGSRSRSSNGGGGAWVAEAAAGGSPGTGGGGGGSGRKKKSGKVPAKKQTRYPKRSTK